MPWGVLSIKSVGEEYQFFKREYHSLGEENNVEKGKGEAISSRWEEYQVEKSGRERQFWGGISRP